LGWQICQPIVLAHGGYMRVSVRRGGGARFSVPVFVHQASVIGTILVVHHDPLVRAASHTRPGARRVTATLFHFQSWSVARTDLVHTPRIGGAKRGQLEVVLALVLAATAAPGPRGLRLPAV